MRVVATSTGFDGVCIREPGDEFDMPEGSCDKVPVKDAAGKAVPGTFEPETWFRPVKTRRNAPEPEPQAAGSQDLV